MESDLSTTGSTRTPDDVQNDLDTLSADMYAFLFCYCHNVTLTVRGRRSNDREKQALTTERERQINLTRNIENDLHSMRLRENEISNQIREKVSLEQLIETLRKDIAIDNVTMKVATPQSLGTSCPHLLIQSLDAKIAEGHGPIERLESEHHRAQKELQERLSEAQRAFQDVNISVDKLEGINKAIERYTPQPIEEAKTDPSCPSDT